MDLHLPEALQHFRPPSASAEYLPSLYVSARIERALLKALAPADAEGPPRLSAAVRHALFPGGGRLRPKLCLAVAQACGDPHPDLAEAVAASLEMMHCASLVHDDLPCFDAADTRRGQPTVHRAFGENIAVLAGDHLIVLAFENLARNAAKSPRLASMVGLLARGVGSPFGIIAGQAWESENKIDAARYRRAKTGALFEAASALGAVAAGEDPQRWGVVGAKVGEAYQVADDILDVLGDADRLGKPVGQDAALGRPNAVNELGLAGARKLFDELFEEANRAVPPCANPGVVRAWMGEAERRAKGLF
ncbi:MAG: polyprenyl synthetase family protein [Polyangiaceae bacterium]|nr:polyprenyl synthetase family protein [Polyangiaceae bacterium]